MASIEYDPDSDSMYVNISSRKVYLSVEFGEKLLLDISESRIPVGVEILTASQFISDLFGKQVSKKEVKNVLCSVTQKDAIYLNFEMHGARRETARFALPKIYRSPILAV